jgi:hypothetical protein
MSAPRKWLLVGLWALWADLLFGCTSPQSPQLMNGFYVEKPPPPRQQHNSPPQINTASQPAVTLPAPQQPPASPPPAAPSEEVQPLSPHPSDEYIEPPVR